jgi:RND family efflux transporter MFP subunit
VAAADVERTKALVGYTRITSPFPGIVTARNVHTGHFGQPTSNNQNPVMFTVARVDVLRIFVDVPEDVVEKAGPGSQVVVRVPYQGGREYPATVTRVSGVLNPNSRTMLTEIDIDNRDRSLLAGAYAVARITATTGEATLIPTSCILAADETHYVYLIEKDRAVKYRVQVGHTNQGLIQVFGRRKASSTTGNWDKFTSADQVIAGNLGALADDMTVKVE